MVPRRRFGAWLWRLADLVQADERGRSFRAKAFRRAVWALDDLGATLDETRAEMLAVPGIGPGVVRLIDEFRRTGTLAEVDRLTARYPVDVAELRRLPRMTPTLLNSLKREAGVETAADLRRAIDSGQAAALRGVGSSTLHLWRRILDLPPTPGAVPSYRAWVLATEASDHLTRHLGGPAVVAGGVRRLEEWVDAADVVVVADAAAARTFLDDTAVAATTRWEGDTALLATHGRIPLRVHVSTVDRFGASRVRATGPADHVAAVLDPIGDVAMPTEADVYRARGLEWIPPAARSLDPTIAGDVVTAADLRGDLHVHSDWSPDGRMALPDLFAAAVRLGFGYVAVTDHTIGLRFGGLDGAALERQAAEIDRLRPSFPELRIWHGAEVNIERDGGLDLGDEALEMLDLAIAGLHSHFGLPAEEQTRRLVRALTHPKVRVLAHLTGRRIGVRPAIDVDFDAVIAAAVGHGVALEVNGHRDRLDLSAPLIGRAARRGAAFAANSDGHTVAELANISNAVATLQRAGIGRDGVVNVLSPGAFARWLGSDRVHPSEQAAPNRG